MNSVRNGIICPAFILAFASAAALSPLPSLADDPGFAPCLLGHPPTGDPPQGTVKVQILSIKPNSDMEGDDDAIPFYDNKADIYGTVTIDGVTHDLPKINDDNFPHWHDHEPDADHPRGGILTQTVTAVPDPTGLSPLPVSIIIEIRESDGGLTGDDDVVDINPSEDANALELEFDLCALRLSGDVNARDVHARITVSGGDAENAAEMTFKVSLLDDRPVSLDDLALMDLDLIQVIPNITRLVAGKPTVVRALVANNYDSEVLTKLELRVTGVAAQPIIEVFDLPPIQAGEVKSVVLNLDDPLIFPKREEAYTIRVVGTLDPDGELPDTGHSVPEDCRAQNNGASNRTAWHVVPTRIPSLLWAKVGMDLDIGQFVPDSHFEEIRTLGEGYIRGVYPISGLDQSVSPVGIPVFITPALDWLRAIVPGTDAADPFLMVAQLSNMGAVLGHERIMGVLPNKDWFERFEGWSDVTGLSLGINFPHGVIFLPRLDKSLGVGPSMTLPAHELGHTFRLSTDTAIKPKWACSLDLAIGDLLCGANKGFDEYTNDLSGFDKGNPARGLWLAQGGEVAEIVDVLALGPEQCDSHCFMGSSKVNDWDPANWPSRGRWVDPADYEALLDALQSAQAATSADAELIHISGMIALQGRYQIDGKVLDVGETSAFVLDTSRLPRKFAKRVADVISDEVARIGEVRFLDGDGRIVGTGPIPAHFAAAESDTKKRPVALPVTAFGLTYVYPEATREIQVLAFAEDGNMTLLSTVPVSDHAPAIHLDDPYLADDGQGRRVLNLSWQGRDQDGDALDYTVAIRRDRDQHWWPAAYETTVERLALETGPLEPGGYSVMVIASDGVHLTPSTERSFELPYTEPHR